MLLIIFGCNNTSFTRYKNENKKPKRRITPTLLNSKPATSQFFHGSGDIWNEVSPNQAFTSSSTQHSSDLKQALIEDRRQLQKEIVSKRYNKQIIRDKSKGECKQSSRTHSDKVVTRKSDGRGFDRSADNFASPLLKSIPVVSPCDNQAISSVQVEIVDSHVTITDEVFLVELAKLYSRIIKG